MAKGATQPPATPEFTAGLLFAMQGKCECLGCQALKSIASNLIDANVAKLTKKVRG